MRLVRGPSHSRLGATALAIAIAIAGTLTLLLPRGIATVALFRAHFAIPNCRFHASPKGLSDLVACGARGVWGSLLLLAFGSFSDVFGFLGRVRRGCARASVLVRFEMAAAVSRLGRATLSKLGGSRVSWARPMGYAAQASMEEEPWLALDPTRPLEAMHSQEKDRGVQWVFLGCPGVGKGTYASRLAKLVDVPHIAMGDLVRLEILNKAPMAEQLKRIMGSGQLLPDEIIFNLLSKRLEGGAARGESGFILDGFPRTVNQAEIMDEVANIDLVVNLKLREDVLVTKCLGRRICSQCGGNFNVASIDVDAYDSVPRIFMPPLLPPPSCASKMTTRADDTEEVVRARLRVYYEESQPVEDFYRRQGMLLDFDVAGGIPETWPRLLSALNLEDNRSVSQDSRKMTA